MQKWLARNGMRVALNGFAVMARAQGSFRPLAESTIEAIGKKVARMRGIRLEARNPQELGETWQRAFAAKKHVPIVRTDATTAYGEIHTPCPLRGSGDLEACHRMMGYDRAFMNEAGAQFVVMRSQAEPGVKVCQVAIRSIDVPADDLVPAHVRARRASR